MHFKNMSFTTTPLSLPILLLSKQKIKDKYLNRVFQKHLQRYKHYFTKKCNKSGLHLIDKNVKLCHNKYEQPCLITKTQIRQGTNRQLIWKLPPNLYDISKEPFLNKKGRKIVNWMQTVKKPTNALATKMATPNNNKDINTSNINSYCNKHKDVFFTNARSRKPTSRLMIQVYGNKIPEEPGPTTYFQTEPKKETEVKAKRFQPNPHNFLRHTTVPEKKCYFMREVSSFEPGPGRYENRYLRSCLFCRKKTIYRPGTLMEIDVQKRFKFRRLPYKYINWRKYCDPELSHIPGHGFRHLFIIPEKDQLKPVSDTEISQPKKKKLARDVVHRIEKKYIRMIQASSHEFISWRTNSLPEIPIKIRYASQEKRNVRKQLVHNKKIIFSSSQPRWKDSRLPTPLTTKDIKRIKLSLPPERRCYDHPVMSKKPEEIQSKLKHLPAHMDNVYIREIPKPDFKFPPLPEPKILVTENDIRPSYAPIKRIFASRYSTSTVEY